MNVTAAGIVNETNGGTVSMTVKDLENKTAGVTTGIDMTTTKTLTIINRPITNRVPMSKGKESGWTRRCL